MNRHYCGHMFCPVCGKHFDSAEDFKNPDATPKAGDVSVCIACAHILTFEPSGDRLRLRKLEIEEIARLEVGVALQALRLSRAVVLGRRKWREQGGEHG